MGRSLEEDSYQLWFYYIGWPGWVTECRRLRRRLNITDIRDILARKEGFMCQLFLTIFTVLVVICKCFADASRQR